MGLLECASGASVWRGYDYYKENKVVNIEKTGDNTFSATVLGRSGAAYAVELHIDHPRKSKCSCPHAAGKRIVCKHQVATYFTIFPKEAERLCAEAEAYQEEEEKRQEELYERVIAYVGKMKKPDLCQSLLELLFDGPEWQYDRFIREHDLDREL